MEILKLNAISPIANDIFDGKYKLVKESSAPVGIMVRSAAMHDYTFNSELLAIARAGAGVNNIPIDRCTQNGIAVFNTPGANANAVKELVLCAMLLSCRKVIPSIAWAESLKGKGAEVAALVEKGKSNFIGGEIEGKTVGVIGLGAIGAMVANDSVKLGMKALGYDPFISIDAAWGLSSSIKKVNDIDSILRQSDFISLHVPFNAGTKELINAQNIAKMKDGAVIINCSRGELVENKAIIDAVKSGKIARYVTDFPVEELLGIENIICIPHLGASTPEAEDNCAVAAARELVDYIENGNIYNSVNLPACSASRSGVCRITIIHLNIKDMLNKITSVISAKNHNMANFVNKSRGEYAYSIVDIDNNANEELKKSLEAIEGVIRVRII